jgi:hypothetical protein
MNAAAATSGKNELEGSVDGLPVEAIGSVGRKFVLQGTEPGCQHANVLAAGYVVIRNRKSKVMCIHVYT